MPPRAPRHTARIAFSWALGLLLALVCLLVAATTYVPLRHVDLLISAASANDLDPALVAAVIRCESRFRDTIVSPAGAIGLMQIMPETGAWIAAQLGEPNFAVAALFDPATNLRFGTWYLAHLMDRFGDLQTALWAYNAGPSRAEAWSAGIEPPLSVTATYVARIERFLPIYRGVLRVPWLYRVIPPLPL